MLFRSPKAGQGDSALVQQVKLQYFSDRQKSPQGGYEANAGRYGVGYYNRASRHLGSESDYNAGSGLALERPDGGKRGGQGAPHPSILETQAAANGVYCEGYELGHQFRVGKSGAVSDSQLAKDALVTLDGRYPRWNSLPKLRAAFISGFTDGYRNRKADPARR